MQTKERKREEEMIDERDLIKTLLQWKENGNEIAGLKEGAMLDKVINEVINMSIRTRITATDILDTVKQDMCQYCVHAEECD